MSAVWNNWSSDPELTNKGLSYTALHCVNNLSFGSEQATKKKGPSGIVLHCVIGTIPSWIARKAQGDFAKQIQENHDVVQVVGNLQQTEVTAAVCFMVCFANRM